MMRLLEFAFVVQNDIQWRKDWGVDEILTTFPQHKQFKQILDYWPGRLHGEDRNCVPIWWERIGQVDSRSFLTAVSEEDVMMFHVCDISRLWRFFNAIFFCQIYLMELSDRRT